MCDHGKKDHRTIWRNGRQWRGVSQCDHRRVRIYEIGSVPSWVDRVCSARLLMEQYDYYGLYQGGFWNSILGQTGCTKTTSGYNYIAMDDDVWVYTGVTSVGGDESNLGFILVNQRTKEARYYSCAGANENAGNEFRRGCGAAVFLSGDISDIA